MKRATSYGLLLLMLLGTACSDDNGIGPVPTEPVETVAVSPDRPLLMAGETLQLTATPKAANGTPLSNRPIAWKSNRTDIALISSTGMLTGVVPGTAEITASSGGKEGKALVTVLSNAPDPVVSVSVDPQDPAVVIGETVQLYATPRSANGTPLARAVTWTSGHTDIASVSNTGLVTAAKVGTAEIRAASGGMEGKVTVTVTATAPGQVAAVELDATTLVLEEGGAQQITATPKDALGQPVPGRVVQWTSTSSAVASVGTFGAVTAIRAGTTVINAKVDGVTASAMVTVTANYAFDLIYEQAAAVGQAPELYQLDIRDANAFARRMFAPGKPAMEAVVAPDGSRIAFVVATVAGNYIFVADRNGDNAVQLTFDGYSDQPTWSSDGRIAFRKWAPNTDSDIWVMSATDGSGAVNVTADQGATSQHEPSWSTGQPGRIAYSMVSNGIAHIWTMNPNGGDKQEITTGEVYDYEPAWSPNGQDIVFGRTGAAVPGSDLFIMNAAGSSLRRLTNLPLGQFSPAYSPDGRLIAFMSAHEGSKHIYTVWTDGSKLARRTSGELGHANPAWIER